MTAYIFPGQGAQFPGMGKEVFNASLPAGGHGAKAKQLFKEADELLGFEISKIMFTGTEEELKETRVTQPAVFIHSVALLNAMAGTEKPDMVAGHSLGEFSALVANEVLTFKDGLLLVAKRAEAMQKACDQQKSTMAAILGLEDEVVESVCADVDRIVVAANYNCPGQLIISGELKAVEEACERLKERGAKRALVLPVGGAFHSPLMEPARKELSEAIENTTFNKPSCPIYQNVSTFAVSDPKEIKENLLFQLTSPVKWTQSVQNMIKDGATDFVEIGPGKVLQGLVKKIDRSVNVASAGL